MLSRIFVEGARRAGRGGMRRPSLSAPGVNRGRPSSGGGSVGAWTSYGDQAAGGGGDDVGAAHGSTPVSMVGAGSGSICGFQSSVPAGGAGADGSTYDGGASVAACA